MVNSAQILRLLASAAGLLPLVAAYPGINLANNRRGGREISSYGDHISRRMPMLVRDPTAGNPCNTASDCDSDAPMCDFPWRFGVSPYNQPQRVCMLATPYETCDTNAACTTNLCYTSAESPYCISGGSRCKYDIDCFGQGRCGKASDVRGDGTSLQGQCLIMGGQPCSGENAECQSGFCNINSYCAKDTTFGLPAVNDYSCSGNLRLSRGVYLASTELADGTFAFASKTYFPSYCGWTDVNGDCTVGSDCYSGNCLDIYNEGAKRCASGASVGTKCSQNVECFSSRCAITKGSTTPVCTYQPVGGPCEFPSHCGSGVCSNGKCQVAALTGTCFFSSDCITGTCDGGLCGSAVTTSTTTSSATSTTTTSSSTSSDAATTTSSTAMSTSTSTTTSASTASSTTSASTSTPTTTSTTTSSSSSSTTSKPISTSTTSTSTSTTTSKPSSASVSTTASSTTSKPSTMASGSTTTATSKSSSTTTATTTKPSTTSTTTSKPSTSASSTSSTTSKASSSTTTTSTSKSSSTTASTTTTKPSTTTTSSKPTTTATTTTSKSSTTTTTSKSSTTTTSKSSTTTSKSNTTSKSSSSATTTRVSTVTTTSKSTSTSSKPTATTTSSTTSKATTTTTSSVTLLPSGAVCSDNTICQSQYCRAKLNPDGTRATQANCDVKKASGAACYQNAGCISGVCVIAQGQSSGSCK
ncbi:hypothetical protein A4X09_0g6712 [Tilletia walkeri]|uniref:Uncharacterized protein n=1 Tax=Tilletia walkeri TaxID=117179 RepID=A0A8X7N4M9_9BASI|nr:hypothetical protein A4X09_0g6712 [Tilletia walkeri]